MMEKLSTEQQQTLSDNLKHFRDKVNMTFEELAKQVNMSPTTIKNIEYNERNNTTYEDVELIANALGVHTQHLLTPIDRIELDYIDFDNSILFRILNPNVDVKIYHIISLFQFLVYLPLIPPDSVYSIVNSYDVVYSSEKSILSYIDFLYRNIGNQKAKKYADFLHKRLTYSGLKKSRSEENALKDFLRENIGGFMKGTTEYHICADCNESFDSAEDYLECMQEYYKETKKQVYKTKLVKFKSSDTEVL